MICVSSRDINSFVRWVIEKSLAYIGIPIPKCKWMQQMSFWMQLTLSLPFLRRNTLSCLPLAFIADLSSLLCLWLLRGSPLHSVITRTLFTLALRSGSMGEPWALCSEPDGVLEGDTDWLVGQPVSSIVNRHTDSRCQEQTAGGRQRTQAGSQSSRPSCHHDIQAQSLLAPTFNK